MVDYNISSDDMYGDDKKKKKKKKSGNSGSKKSNGLSVKPFYIHLGLILLLFLFLAFYFMDVFDFGLSSERMDQITLIGEISKMNQPYVGNMLIDSSDYTLETSNSRFDAKTGDVQIEGFNGQIRLFNRSMIIEGVAQKAVFKNNELNLNGGMIRLTARKKVSIDLFFKNVGLYFDEGRIKVNNDFNLNFENTSVSLSAFDATMNYDGKFVFTGSATNFTVMRDSPRIYVAYQNE